MRNQIFILLACVLAFSYGDVVNYVPSPTCATSAGCDFTSPIWSGPLNNQSQVSISSNVSITLYLSNIDIKLISLRFGLDGSAPVQIILNNATIALPMFNVPYDQQINLVWGDSSSLKLTSSSTLSGYTIVGSNVSLSNSQFGAMSNLLIGYMETIDSIIAGVNNLVITEAHVTNSEFISDSNIATLYCDGCEFDSNLNVQYFGNITNSYFKSYSVVTVQSNATVAVYNTNFTCKLNLEQDSVIAFYAGNNQISVSTLSVSTGTIILGDNIDNRTAIDTVILGNNVNLSLGQTIFSPPTINNIQSNAAGLSQISIVSGVQLSSTTPLNAAIYIGASSWLAVNSVFQLSPGSSISGPGMIKLSGELDCTGSNISVNSAQISNGAILRVDTLFASSIIPDDIDGGFGNIIGNVVISTQNNGFGIFGSTYNITGNFTQIGGYINCSIQNIAATTPLVVVGGSITIDSVTFIVVIGKAVNNKDHYLLMRSLSKSATLKNSNIQNYVQTDLYSLGLSTTITDGDLYMTVTDGDTSKGWFTKKRIIIISAVGGGVAGLIVVAIAFAIRRRSRRHHYHAVQ